SRPESAAWYAALGGPSASAPRDRAQIGGRDRHRTGVLGRGPMPCSGLRRQAPGVPHTCPNGGGFQCVIPCGENSAGRRFAELRRRTPRNRGTVEPRNRGIPQSERTVRLGHPTSVSFTRAELKSFTGATLPDLIAEGVRLLF